MVTCDLCQKHFKFFGNTTNLKEHLRRLHSKYLKKVEENTPKSFEANNSSLISVLPESGVKQEQSDEIESSTSFFTPYFDVKIHDEVTPASSTSLPSVEPSLKRKKLFYNTIDSGDTDVYELDKSLTEMVVKDYLSLSVVEGQGFKNFVAKLKPHYVLPTKKVLKHELLLQHFDKIHSEIANKLKFANYISITTDFWKSNNQKLYVSIAAHFIYNDKLNSFTLATREVDDTSKSIAVAIEQILTELEIQGKIVCVITNDVPHLKEAIVTELSMNHQPCIANTINSCVNETLVSCRGLLAVLTKCHTMLSTFTQDTYYSTQLQQKQFEMSLDTVKLKLSVHSRWTSTYVMLERLLTVKQPFCDVLTAEELSLQNLCDQEWAVITDCVTLLKPLIQITEELSSEQYVSISKVIPLIRGLQYSLNMLSVYTEAGLELKTVLSESVTSWLESLESNRIVAMATFLDPRFKKTGFGLEENAKNAQQWVTDELCSYIINQNKDKNNITEFNSHSSNSSTLQMDESDLWAHFDNKVTQQTSVNDPTSLALLTVIQYVDTKLLPRTEDPLKYWEVHSKIFQELSVLAQKYLSIPANSIPSERLFTKYGYTLCEKRNALDSKRYNEIIFLHDNM